MRDRGVGNVLSAGVAGLSPETTYYYRVRAYRREHHEWQLQRYKCKNISPRLGNRWVVN